MEVTTENYEAQKAGVQVEGEHEIDENGQMIKGRSRGRTQVMKNYVFKEHYLKIRGRIKY